MNNAEKLRQLNEMRAKAELGGGIEAIEKQHKAGKKTARERILMLLDEESFVEMDVLVESRSTDFGMQSRRVPGDGVITGHGTIDSRP
ncbi:MAG: methylmalonyl-CoA carboxyltransferase, partial [Clostridiaceae bacterium]|nr:methylmalonyl-CoA carboxyltransferase [Clostridiaceae bacterium]